MVLWLKFKAFPSSMMKRTPSLRYRVSVNNQDYVRKKPVKWPKSRSEYCDFTKIFELHIFQIEK